MLKGLLYLASAAVLSGAVAGTASPVRESSAGAIVPHHPSEAPRPNIVLILADDLGFTDLASYGSEINTPTLDGLADQGIRFSNYHSAANCACLLYTSPSPRD